MERQNAKRKPNRLRKLSAKADTRSGERSVHVPTAALRTLQGRGAKDAILLYAVYCIEQQRRGAVQLSDDVAAHKLGWTAQKAKRWRKVLEETGAIQLYRHAAGRSSAVYCVPDAFHFAPFQPERLEEDRTPRLTTLALDDGTTIPVCGSDRQMALMEHRLLIGGPQCVAELREWAATAREAMRRHIDASEILSGPLYGVGLPDELAEANEVYWERRQSTPVELPDEDDSDIPY